MDKQQSRAGRYAFDRWTANIAIAAIVLAALAGMTLISNAPPPAAEGGAGLTVTSAGRADDVAAQPAMLPVAPLPPGAEPESLAQSCRLIRAEVRSCSCTVDFLVTHLGPEQAAILLAVWSAGAGYAGDTKAAFAAVYRQYDHPSVLRATSGFFWLRTKFQQQCLPWGDMFTE